MSRETFVSYAQNYEDVMLWRAFGTVANGFYVDVGAADPDLDSVTRAFYERGWHGINIEPEPGYAQALRDRRPRDLTLAVALGRAPGRIEMSMLPGTGLSTLDPAIAHRHAAAGLGQPVIRETEMSTLAAVCAEHATAEIHFLKIDVEGFEREVLLGADFQRFRPQVIVIEATEPNSSQRTMDRFEDILQQADYRFRWFDGLNAFYVAAEHDDRLAPCFDAPPNVYDWFVDHRLMEQIARTRQLEAELGRVRTELQDELRATQAELAEKDRALHDSQGYTAMLLRHAHELGRMNAEFARINAALETNRYRSDTTALELDAARAEARQLRAAMDEVRRSTSWRITEPMRRVVRLARR